MFVRELFCLWRLGSVGDFVALERERERERERTTVLWRWNKKVLESEG